MKIGARSAVSHVTVGIVCFLVGIALMYPFALQEQKKWFVEISESFRDKSFGGRIDVKVIRADGTVEEYSNHNLVVTLGLKAIRDVLGFSNATSIETNATDDISLSNDATPLASWTKLPTEETGSGLARQDGTATVVNSTSYQTTYTFTATATVTVQCAGLHWNPTSNSDNNLFAAATFTQVTLNNNDQIQITWTVNMQSG